MLYKCANKTCNTPFRRLREGKLFRVETEYFEGRGLPLVRRPKPARRIEHYWLCDSCYPFVTLTFDRGRGVVTVPLPDGIGEKTVRIVPIDAALAMEEPEETARRTLTEVMK